MRIEGLFLAEAVAINGGGVPSLIGIGPSIIVAPRLPFLEKKSIAVFMSDEDGPPLQKNDVLSVNVMLILPDGASIGIMSHSMLVGEKQWPDLPATPHFVGDFMFAAETYGSHQLKCTVATRGDRAEARRTVHVVGTPEQDHDRSR